MRCGQLSAQPQIPNVSAPWTILRVPDKIRVAGEADCEPQDVMGFPPQAEIELKEPVKPRMASVEIHTYWLSPSRKTSRTGEGDNFIPTE